MPNSLPCLLTTFTESDFAQSNTSDMLPRTDPDFWSDSDMLSPTDPDFWSDSWSLISSDRAPEDASTTSTSTSRSSTASLQDDEAVALPPFLRGTNAHAEANTGSNDRRSRGRSEFQKRSQRDTHHTDNHTTRLDRILPAERKINGRKCPEFSQTRTKGLKKVQISLSTTTLRAMAIEEEYHRTRDSLTGFKKFY